MTSSATTSTPSRFSGWILLLGALTAMGPLSIDMYLPSFGQIAREIGVPGSQVQLTLASYFIGLALGQAIYGPLSDHYGRRKPLLLGLSLYALASLGCALVSQIDSLIALRALQALGGCAGLVISRAIVRDRCSPQQAAQVYSSLVLVMGAAPILAPLLGSWLITFTTWRVIFVLMALFALGVGIWAYRTLPETRPATSDAAFSWRKVIQEYALLLRDRRFMAYAITGGLASSGLFAYITGSPIVLMQVYGLSPTVFSLLFGSIAFSYIMASQVNALLLRRFSIDQVLQYGVLIPAIGSGALLLVTLLTMPPLWLVIGGIFSVVMGLGFIAPNAVAGALTQHGERAGTASALMGCLQFGLATLAGMTMGLWHRDDALPLALVLALCGVGALLLHRIGVAPLLNKATA